MPKKQKILVLWNGQKNNVSKVTILVCTNVRYSEQNPSCGARGSKQLFEKLQQVELKNIEVREICCMGHCMKGAVVKVLPSGRFYHGVTVDDMPNLLKDLQNEKSEGL